MKCILITELSRSLYLYTIILIATGVKEICKEAGGEDQKVFDIF